MPHDLHDLLDATAAQPRRPADVAAIRARGRRAQRTRRMGAVGGAAVLAVLVTGGLTQLVPSAGPRIDDSPDVVGSPTAPPGQTETTTGAPVPAGDILERPTPGKPAEARPGGPAAPTCPQAAGESATVTVHADIPDPRCVAVAPGQQVRVVSAADASFTARLGGFLFRLAPGEDVVLDLPVSSYLAAGMHSFESDYGPAEADVWVLEAPAASAGEQAILDALVAFARDPSDATFGDLPLADEVSLGLGPVLRDSQPAGALRDPEAWSLEAEGFAGRDGAFSVLAELARHDQPLDSLAGDHPRCAGPPTPAPEPVADLRRLSVQPALDTLDSCLGWFAVDVFVDWDDLTIAAVTLDLWEP